MEVGVLLQLENTHVSSSIRPNVRPMASAPITTDRRLSCLSCQEGSPCRTRTRCRIYSSSKLSAPRLSTVCCAGRPTDGAASFCQRAARAPRLRRLFDTCRLATQSRTPSRRSETLNLEVSMLQFLWGPSVSSRMVPIILYPSHWVSTMSCVGLT